MIDLNLSGRRAVVADMADRDSIESSFKAVLAGGTVDILVSNARATVRPVLRRGNRVGSACKVAPRSLGASGLYGSGRRLSKRLLSALLLVLASAPSAADGEERSAFAYDAAFRRLYTDCRPVDGAVFVDEEARNAGVDAERLERTMESRLRAARLFDSDAGIPYVLIMVEVNDFKQTSTISTEVSLHRYMLNPDTETEVVTQTWERESIGYFGSAVPASRVHEMSASSVSEFLDEFILDYLDINDCDQERQR